MTVLRLNTRRCETPSVTQWDAAGTAVIICDMWDIHWCKLAAQRVADLAPRVDALASAVRARGSMIVHAPSNTMAFYSGTPQRDRTLAAPPITPPVPIGTRKLDLRREAPLPIDDSDGGCDDAVPGVPPPPIPWTRQHPAIAIADEDVISDSGSEIYNVFVAKGIANVIMTGVHANVCILSRPFGIRQLVMLGMNVVLARDLTDSLYNPRRPPMVSHLRGTELVVAHIERYWCPSIVSSDI